MTDRWVRYDVGLTHPDPKWGEKRGEESRRKEEDEDKEEAREGRAAVV